MVALPSFNSFTSPSPLVFVSFASLLLMRRLRYANSSLIHLISVFLSNLKAEPPNLWGVVKSRMDAHKQSNMCTCVLSSLQCHHKEKHFKGGTSLRVINLTISSAQFWEAERLNAGKTERKQVVFKDENCCYIWTPSHCTHWFQPVKYLGITVSGFNFVYSVPSAGLTEYSGP